MRPLYVFGRDGFVDLAEEIRAVTDAGSAVLWVSGSGTRQVLVRVDGGPLTRRRYSTGNVHFGDGWDVLLLEPWTATSCGMSCASGYRSTEPVLVAAIENAADVEAANEIITAMSRAGVTQEQWDAIPPGHPPGPCGALYCKVRLAAEGTGGGAQTGTAT